MLVTDHAAQQTAPVFTRSLNQQGDAGRSHTQGVNAGDQKAALLYTKWQLLIPAPKYHFRVASEYVRQSPSVNLQVHDAASPGV
jgi:hypothetical protein